MTGGSALQSIEVMGDEYAETRKALVIALSEQQGTRVGTEVE